MNLPSGVTRGSFLVAHTAPLCFGVLAHGPELEDGKGSPAMSDASLAEKYGSRRRKTHGENDERDERQADHQRNESDGEGNHAPDDLLRRFYVEAVSKDKGAWIEPVQRQFAQEPLHERTGIFNHHAVQSKIKKFANRHRSATVLHGDDDAVDAGLRIAEGAKVSGKAFELPVDRSITLCVDDIHACVAPGSQSLDDRACALAATQHVDALAEDREANDPFIYPSPDNEDNGKNGYAGDQNIGTDVHVWKEIDDPCERKGKNTENQQQAKVDLPAV